MNAGPSPAIRLWAFRLYAFNFWLIQLPEYDQAFERRHDCPNTETICPHHHQKQNFFAILVLRLNIMRRHATYDVVFRLCKFNPMVMKIKYCPRTALVILTSIIIILQAAGSSFAQTRMSLATAGGVGSETLVICTPDGFKTINWSGPTAPSQPNMIDCECPACAFLANDRLSGITVRIALVTRLIIIIDAQFAPYTTRPQQSLLSKPDKARAPPVPS